MEKYNTAEVFTPTTPAKLTFIERETINSKLVDSLMTPGKQIVIHGRSGTGKTTLIKNKVDQLYENKIYTSCHSGLTLNQVMINAFDKLGIYYTSRIQKSGKKKIGAQIKSEYLALKAEIEKDNSETKERSVPIQINAQRLAQFFGEIKACWILEDFHKIQNDEKSKLSQVMKVFMDMASDYPEVKIIAIGAVSTAREVVNYDIEMQNRVSEILVEPMSDNEIAKIIDKGEKCLNVSFGPINKATITRHANGIASVCHQLCLNVCFNNNIYNTVETKVSFTNQDLQKSIDKYIEEISDSLKEKYEKAIGMKKTRGHNYARSILEIMINENKEEISYSRILNIFKKEHPKNRTNRLRHYINELTSPERDEVLHYNEEMDTYTFRSLFFEGYCYCSLNKNTKSKITSTELADYIKRVYIMDEDLDVDEMSTLDTYYRNF